MISTIFENLHLISFAYCGFAFFTYNMHVFLGSGPEGADDLCFHT